MTDFGLMLQAPIVNLLESATAETIRVFDNIKPEFLLTFGYTLSNQGDDPVQYIAGAMGDALPRNAITGLSIEMGFTRTIHRDDWKIFTFTIAREAEDLLVTCNPDGSFEYQSGWGDISFVKNVLGGSTDNDVNLHEGWQVNVAEFFYLRGGSYTELVEYGGRNYSTSGFALRLSGGFKIVELLAPDAIGNDVFAFIAAHFDIVYDHSEYSDHEILGGTKFDALTFIVR